MAQSDDIQVARVPFIGPSTSRDNTASKDERFVNCYFDPIVDPITQNGTLFLVKRPGLSQNVRPAGGSAAGRGIYSWNGNLYSVFANKIYKGSSDLGVTLTTSSGMCGISETRPSAGTPYLCVNDGARLYAIQSNDTVTTVTSNFPANTTDLVYFDTYLFILSTIAGNSGAIRNCDPDTPATWDVTNFITPVMNNGAPVGIARLQDFIVYFSDRHMQAFYDNANSAGGPLENYPQAFHDIGCASQTSISFVEGVIAWVGKSRSGGYCVYMMEQIGSPQVVSGSVEERLLNAEDTDIATCRGNLIKICGHIFYVLKLTESDRTLVYDLKNKLWCEWQVAGGSTAFPPVAYIEHSGVLLAQHPTNGWIYNVSPDVYQDDSTNFTVLARFGRSDFNTGRYKFQKSIEILGDKQASSTPVSYQYSDDDYNTLSTATTFDMAETHNIRMGGGRFLRRSHQISYAGSNPLRLEGLEIRFRIGDV